MYWKSDPMFVCRLEDKDLPALGGPAEKVRGGGVRRARGRCLGWGGGRFGRLSVPAVPRRSYGSRRVPPWQDPSGTGVGLRPRLGADRGFPQASPAVADEDSCSSSTALSPSSSPQSMASGSGCAPSKCVCSSCGLEIVDKYLLKVSEKRAALPPFPHRCDRRPSRSHGAARPGSTADVCLLPARDPSPRCRWALLLSLPGTARPSIGKGLTARPVARLSAGFGPWDRARSLLTPRVTFFGAGTVFS